jgi:hypothetical protein
MTILAGSGRHFRNPLCADAAVVDAVSEDGRRKGETKGTFAANGSESAAVAHGMSATDDECGTAEGKGAMTG